MYLTGPTDDLACIPLEIISGRYKCWLDWFFFFIFLYWSIVD